MARSQLIILLSIFCFQWTFGQLSETEIQQGYDYYNSKIFTSAEKNLLSTTLNPNEIEFACKWINTDSIFKNFKSQKSFFNNKLSYLITNLDSAFSVDQLNSLNRKFQNLESISLKKKKLKATYELGDSSYFRQSFPVIQKAKDGNMFAFTYEEANFSKVYGRIRIEKKIKDEWYIVGWVNIPLYDLQKLKKDLAGLPQEYQVINSYMFGKDDYVLNEFIAIIDGIENPNSF